jgi:AraC-like DNA-binding protein
MESPRRPLTSDEILLDVVGPRTTYTDLALSADTLVIAVRLQPAAINGLSGQPSAEWVDQRLPLADALRADVNRLRKQLAYAPTLADRLAALRDALRSWYASPPSLPPAVPAAIQHFETPSSSASPTVRDVADRVGVSTRHLRALFRRHVGLSPKMFARVKRLHRAVRAFRQHPTAPWSRLALETGFYDQSHLAADFQSLLGETPSAFRARDLAFTGRV